MTLMHKTIERSRGGQRQVDASRCLLAESRRLLNRAWRISGGSDDELRLAVRQRLTEATLSSAPDKPLLVRRAGHTCVVCGGIITVSEIQHEMVLGHVTIWAHIPCHSIWRQESERLNDSAHPEAADYVANLRRIVHARLNSGTLLVLLDRKSRVRRGINALCVVCDKAIFADELSQEPVGSRYRSLAHILCYRAWSEESKAVRQSHGDLTTSA